MCAQVRSISRFKVFNEWLASSLVRFLAHDCLDGPLQRRALWAGHSQKLPRKSRSGDKAKIVSIFGQSLAFYLTTTWFPGSFCKWQRDCPCRRRAPSQPKKPFVGKGRHGSHEQGNRRDLIKVYLKPWRLSLELDNDHTWFSLVPPSGGSLGTIQMWAGTALTVTIRDFGFGTVLIWHS